MILKIFLNSRNDRNIDFKKIFFLEIENPVFDSITNKSVRFDFQFSNEPKVRKNTYIRYDVVQNFRQRFVKFHGCSVETSPIKEQTVNVNTIGWRFRENSLPQRDKIVDEQIYRYRVLPRIILTCTGEERLRKIETRDPEGCRCSFVVPQLQRRDQVI